MATNTKKETGVLAIAVEDEAVNVMHVVFGRNGETLDIHPPLSIPRIPYDPKHPSADVIQFHLPQLMDLICVLIPQFEDARKHVDALAVSTFGHVDPSKATVRHVPNRGPEKGIIRTYDIRNDYLKKRVPTHAEIPISLFNDATAMAYGEYVKGYGRPSDRAFAAICLGRGVNAGIVIDGRPLSGHLHPEMAHYLPRYYKHDMKYVEASEVDEENPKCYIHRTCQTGLSSARSVLERLERGFATNENIIDIYAYYIAQLCTALTLTVAPSRIAIGGYMFNAPSLSAILPRRETMAAIRQHFIDQIGSYPEYRQTKFVDTYILDTKLGTNASMIGLFQNARDNILEGAW